MEFDNIVANLPAKVGKELLYIILSDARAHLKPGGQIVVVTISGLKEFIKRNLKEVFGNYKKLKQGREHTVARAVKSETGRQSAEQERGRRQPIARRSA